MNSKGSIDPIKKALYDRLKYIFHVEHDCEIDYHEGTELAMSEERFIEVVTKIVEANMLEKDK